MGSFVGHVIPGSFFIVFALWWMIDTLNCYFRPKTRGKQFHSRIFQYVTCCQDGRQVALMAWVVITVTILGIIVEMILSPLRGHSTPGGANIQHSTMYFCFCIPGVLALILDHCAPFPLRRQVEYISFAMALTVEALLFMFHLDGRIKVDVVMHTLLVYVLYASVIITLVELRKEHSVILALGRSYLMMLQGTWFFQLAFTLYCPWTDPWGHNLNSISRHGTPPQNSSLSETYKTMTSHHMTMKAAYLFSWHMAALFICYFSLFMVGHKRYGSRKEFQYNSLAMENNRGEYTAPHEEDEEQFISSQQLLS